MVASGVASKGLDFAEIQHVINFTMPGEIENYVHQIGRTGRSGKTGIATTFINMNSPEPTLLDLKYLLLEAKQRIPQFLQTIEDPNAGVNGGANGCQFCGGPSSYPRPSTLSLSLSLVHFFLSDGNLTPSFCGFCRLGSFCSELPETRRLPTTRTGGTSSRRRCRRRVLENLNLRWMYIKTHPLSMSSHPYLLPSRLPILITAR
jgi:hypothetical protein